MNIGYQLLGLVGAFLLVFVLYQTIKTRPEQFSREKLSQSFFTMGLIGIFLIVFVTLLVVWLNHTS